MALSDDALAAMAYWGTIQSAVTQRASTADLWAAIRGAQAAEPGGGGLVTVRGVSELRGYAAAIRGAAERLNAARAGYDRTGLAQVITGDMMSTAPWSASGQVLSTLADYQVRFEALFTTPLGRSSSVMLTAKFPNGQLSATVGDLVAALGAFALSSGSLPVGTFNGIGAMSITAV